MLVSKEEFDNYVLLVADSVRYDTYRRAVLPFLKSQGAVREAWAHGTFTWPSHMAMMVGMLPHAHSAGPLYNRYHQQLWRMGMDRGSGGYPDHPYPIVGLDTESSIVDGFRQRGMLTIGTGSVSWFRHPIWRQLFDSFAYIQTAEAQVSWILDRLGAADRPLFLFVNLGETHEPYSHGNTGYEMPEGYQIHKLGRGPLTSEDFARLHERQVRALEFLDTQIGILYQALPSKTLVVFTSDHGECFGEDGFFGHGFYHPTVLRVPLLIFGKGE